MIGYEERCIVLDLYEERWERNVRKIVDEAGFVKELFPDTTAALSIRVVGDPYAVRRFQELISSFVRNNKNIRIKRE